MKLFDRSAERDREERGPGAAERLVAKLGLGDAVGPEERSKMVKLVDACLCSWAAIHVIVQQSG